MKDFSVFFYADTATQNKQKKGSFSRAQIKAANLLAPFLCESVNIKFIYIRDDLCTPFLRDLVGKIQSWL
jgi:hypothetical protein